MQIRQAQEPKDAKAFEQKAGAFLRLGTNKSNDGLTNSIVNGLLPGFVSFAICGR